MAGGGVNKIYFILTNKKSLDTSINLSVSQDVVCHWLVQVLCILMKVFFRLLGLVVGIPTLNRLSGLSVICSIFVKIRGSGIKSPTKPRDCCLNDLWFSIVQIFVCTFYSTRMNRMIGEHDATWGVLSNVIVRVRHVEKRFLLK